MSLRHHCHGTHINHQHFSTGGHSTYMVEFHQGGCPGGNPESHPGVNPRSERSTAWNRCWSTVCFVTPVKTSVQDLGQEVTGLPTGRPGRDSAPGDPPGTAGRRGVCGMAARPAFGSLVPQDGCWVAGRSRNAGRWHGIDDMPNLHVSRWRLYAPKPVGGNTPVEAQILGARRFNRAGKSMRKGNAPIQALRYSS